MNINEFISKLVDDDCIVKNIILKETSYDFVNLISNIESKLAIAMSSSFFNENILDLSNIQEVMYLESVIYLPIFTDDSNVVLITFNPNKISDEFILIDETDSLIHKNNEGDWFYINDELAYSLINSIKNYENSDNALTLKLDTIFEIEEVPVEKTLSKDDEYADFLALRKPKSTKPQIKQKLISDNVVSEILDLKEKSFNNQQVNIQMTELSANLVNELMYFKKRQNPKNLLFKYNKPLIEGNVEFRKLGKISDLKEINEKNNKDTILIATCKQCNNKIVYYNHDIDDLNNEEYVEISNLDDSILMEYLYEYLNSGNGMDELYYFSKGFNLIRAYLISAMKIPIPPIEIQKEIVEASKQSREFFKTVDLLKNQFNSNIFDYKHVLDSINQLKGDIGFNRETNEITTLSRCWRHAYQGLIWPLAISYLVATKGSFEIVEKEKNYLRLFEFVAAFNTIILLSGLPEDVYQKNFYNIWTAKSLNDYKKEMSFGKWFYLSQNLAEVYKNNNFTSKLDEELFKKITSDRFLDILEKSKDLRNEDSHGSQSNVYESEEVVAILDNYLEDIFDILEVYSNYKLVYTTGDLNATREGYNHRVILLNGPCAQPIYDNLTFDNVLMSDSLYLYNPKNNKKLKIKEEFMKFKPTDNYKKNWALFIYYKCDFKEFNAFYKCFQSKEEDYKESIHSFQRDILNMK